MSQTTTIYPAGVKPSGLVCGPTTGCGKVIPLQRAAGEFVGFDSATAPASPLEVWETPEHCPNCGKWCGVQSFALRPAASAGAAPEREPVTAPPFPTPVCICHPDIVDAYHPTCPVHSALSASSSDAGEHQSGVWCANLRCSRCYGARTWMESEIPALRAIAASHAEEIARLRRRVELAERARDRHLPCPDHRDKVRAGECQVCRVEQLAGREMEWLALIGKMPEPTTTETIAAGMGGDTATRAMAAFVNRFANWRREAEAFAAAVQRQLRRSA